MSDTTKQMDWNTLVALAEQGAAEPEPEYVFSNGRKFFQPEPDHEEPEE